MSPFFAEMLGNGMTSGGLAALILSAFVEFTGARRKRLVTTLSVDALAEIRTFLESFGARAGGAAKRPSGFSLRPRRRW